jgi:hypothetical protein
MAPAPATVILRYPSLVQWLADRLATAMTQLKVCGLAETSTPNQRPIALPSFSLSPKQLGRFSSPLPLQLAHRHHTTPEQIGAKLIEQFNLEIEVNPSGLTPKLSLHPNGWLYANFSDRELAQWLQQLFAAAPILSVLTPPLTMGVSVDPLLFQVQYIHARCCCLLRLAQQMQYLELTDAPIETIVAPQPIPWLTATYQWRLHHPAEQQLLRLLMQFPQLLSTPKTIYGSSGGVAGLESVLPWPLPATHLRQQAQQWSNALLRFYRECRLFAKDLPEGLQQSQARLALIYLLRQLTAFWLEALFQVEAPTIL